MESAIPEHLRSTRTRHRRVPDDYVPPYPSFVARHKPSVAQVVMAYFGVQTRGAPSSAAEQAMAWIASRFESNGGPTHWDRARYIDEAGFTNVVTVAYWDDRSNSTAGSRRYATAGPATSESLPGQVCSSSCSIRPWKVMKPCSLPWGGQKASRCSPMA